MVLGAGESGSLVLKPPVVARLAVVGVLGVDAVADEIHPSESGGVIEGRRGRKGGVGRQILWEEGGVVVVVVAGVHWNDDFEGICSPSL